MDDFQYTITVESLRDMSTPITREMCDIYSKELMTQPFVDDFAMLSKSLFFKIAKSGFTRTDAMNRFQHYMLTKDTSR